MDNWEIKYPGQPKVVSAACRKTLSCQRLQEENFDHKLAGFQVGMRQNLRHKLRKRTMNFVIIKFVKIIFYTCICSTGFNCTINCL